MKHFKYFLISLLVSPLSAWAHGEETPGPHGGNVQMPGAFHTELVMGEDQSAMIYLLDINFQNPTIKDSNVKVFFKNKKTNVPFHCSGMANHFHCMPEKKFDPKGELIVQATREKAVGNQAVYKLPLKFKNAGSSQPTPDHSNH